MRAVVLDGGGAPRVTDVPEPDGPGELVLIRACGLCGSDVEKLRPEFAGNVLGHEVAAETQDGRRVALVHHNACGECARCRAGHESTCTVFSEPTIRPGGFAERAKAQGCVDVPDGVDDARATMVEPLACVLRGAERVPPGRVLVVGHGFIGHLFSAVLAHRGDDVFAVDIDSRRSGREPDGPVGAAVICARGGNETAIEAVEPGGTILVFADAGSIPAAPIYRRELTILGTRSATPRFMDAAAQLMPELDLPEPTVVPLARFDDGLDLYRRRAALKVVFTP
jgi:L-iditol 2-dehydrogenase